MRFADRAGEQMHRLAGYRGDAAINSAPHRAREVRQFPRRHTDRSPGAVDKHDTNARFAISRQLCRLSAFGISKNRGPRAA